jgi:hypothetical protein
MADAALIYLDLLVSVAYCESRNIVGSLARVCHACCEVSMNSVKWRGCWPSATPVALVMILVFGLLMGSAGSALAVTCSADYYEQGQTSNSNDNDGITGFITDPSASSLPGSSSNHNDDDHMLLWGEIEEETVPSGQSCGLDDNNFCWVQGGVGMGLVGEGSDAAYNGTNSYEPYYENEGAAGTYAVNFYPNIPINQNSSVGFEVFYDGSTGRDGDPQFEVTVQNSNGTWVELDAGELYYAFDHASARSEVDVRSLSNTCPTMTNGSPWQDFGTNASGTPTATTELELDATGTFTTWTGSPATFDTPPYFFKSLNGAAAFRTNGPASGPP